MIRSGVAFLALCVVGALLPATARAQSTQSHAKHYRLTFVLSYPDGQEPAQTLVLDVPVSSGQAGMAGTSMASGLTGQSEGSVQENLQCTDVRESSAGLAVKVAFSRDVIAPPLPGSNGPLHRNLVFNRQVELVPGKSTRITEEMHVVPLGKGDEVAAPRPAAPQISVTATEL